MTDIQTNEFFAPANTNLLDGLVAEYRHKRSLIERFHGDFKDLDLSPASTAVLKGILTPVVKDDVNFVNAQVLAQQRGIKVTETSSAESDYYVNQITVRAITTEMESVVSGTIFGKKDPRIVKIDKFRLEMIPHGHMALIQNIDKPGSIGEIGTTLGRHSINIGRKADAILSARLRSFRPCRMIIKTMIIKNIFTQRVMVSQTQFLSKTTND